MEDVVFPAVFKICASPGFDNTAIKEIGYRGVSSYFMGKIQNNKSWTIQGWAGLQLGNNSARSVAEVLRMVRSHTADQIIERIVFSGHDGSYIEVSVADVILKRVNFPNNCYTLDLKKYLYKKIDKKKKSVKEIRFLFKNQTGLKIEIRVEDGNLDCDRTIGEHQLHYDGDKVKLLSERMKHYFVVEMKKNIFLEEDKSKKCRKYPNQDFSSYRECDNLYIKNTLAAHWPGLMPIWATDDLTNVSTAFPRVADMKVLDALFKGEQVSNTFCPLPCTMVYVKSKFVKSYDSFKNASLISITFSDHIEVTSTTFDKLSLSTFLSDVGGSMGLWLGLGITQVVGILINLFCNVY